MKFLVYWFFITIAAVFTNNSDELKTAYQEEQIEWTTNVANCLIFLILSIIVVSAVTHGMNRRSEQFIGIILGFIGWLFFWFCLIIIIIFDGIKMRYGDGIKRKIHVYDAKTKTYQSIIDDGTYIFKNGRVVGR